MWVYQQSTGRLSTDAGQLVAIGYSGNGPGKNNPFRDDIEGQGPIPRGIYMIGSPVDTTTHGPFVLALQPDLHNEMHGRSGFLIHGDSKEHPGQASEGCIVVGRDVRERIDREQDRRLVVIA